MPTYNYTAVFALKICPPLCTKKLSFEAIRARMAKTIGGDKHLDFSDETLERRRIIRMHSQVKSHTVMATLEGDCVNSVTIWT